MPARRVGIDLAPAALERRAPGTARHVLNQARALFKLDVPWQWRPLVESRSNPLFAEVEHLRPVIVPGRRTSIRATLFVGTAWARERCDLGFATAYFAPISGPPIVANFFDAMLFTHADNWVRSGDRRGLWITRALARFTIRKARRLFVLSNETAREIGERFPAAKENIRVIPCGVPPPRAEALSTRPEWAGDVGRPYFLNVGLFSENKGQARLIETWGALQRKHPDLPSLVLAGSCDPDYYRAVIRPALDRLPRQHEVKVVGFISEDELAWAYRHALAYLQNSLAEGFGLPVVEAMSYGVPVVAADAPGIIEVAGDAATYFESGRSESLADAVVKVWQDAQLRSRAIAAGSVRIRKYSWSRNAADTASEIEAILNQLR